MHSVLASRPEEQRAASCAALQAKVARMHMLGRLRSKHFYTPVLADRTMDVMLSLLVGELQGSAVSGTALAVGNMLSREELCSVIDKLFQAGLVIVSGEEPERRTVGLSPLGSARMRSYVSDYPDV
jgi:biotin operon repressor